MQVWALLIHWGSGHNESTRFIFLMDTTSTCVKKEESEEPEKSRGSITSYQQWHGKPLWDRAEVVSS